MKKSRLLFLTVPVLWAVCACHKTPDPPQPTDVSAWKGLVFNEIAAHDQTVDGEISGGNRGFLLRTYSNSHIEIQY